MKVNKKKKWLVIVELNTDGELAHMYTLACMNTHARILTHNPRAHAHAHARGLRHPEHPLCARLFLRGELVVLLSADIKEACMGV